MVNNLGRGLPSEEVETVPLTVLLLEATSVWPCCWRVSGQLQEIDYTSELQALGVEPEW